MREAAESRASLRLPPDGENAVAVLMEAARVCSFQEITEAFFEAGGEYRRTV
ncbi:methylmalonyl-CoA mutase N-terminal domain/subunit [Streptomyces sp. LBL]|uniref:hypothetical protein n=1 Tax=Streptomyces sp. LBL TaxID=2940562 RepID=UPI002473BA52|nr:hypothetical protein [Streptomyces sp. LBL]MDH6626157.1 methylmalonyl-CoA mutase N-terminal domain/subunit [Streptomyces sp. LBL]